MTNRPGVCYTHLMNENSIHKTTVALKARVNNVTDGEAEGIMTLPIGTVLRLDCFEPADPSVGIFGESITFEIGVLAESVGGLTITGTPSDLFLGTGIYVELVSDGGDFEGVERWIELGSFDLFGYSEPDIDFAGMVTFPGVLETVA